MPRGNRTRPVPARHPPGVSRAREPQLFENIPRAQRRFRALLDELVAAERGRAGDRSRDGEHGAALVERAVGGDERARAGRCLDDDGDARETADEAVAAGGGEGEGRPARGGRRGGGGRPRPTAPPPPGARGGGDAAAAPPHTAPGGP